MLTSSDLTRTRDPAAESLSRDEDDDNDDDGGGCGKAGENSGELVITW